ncbi:glutamine synthetase, catalytic domain protein [Burkholderia gladioli]|uniref:Glutamine synthetase n=1 Tax=Burkholderia gladioli TaxID=28095 RepID=A0A095F1Z2_BURGA|nr:glutamine synthetase family protein [Burkholderia gladioli]AJW98846.1 glutamine synthetase, catalytic domain protein [Burkholderia gladioli]ASD79883.1 glutamine synthetase [Burkholderia gladioli pv. gladioli]AWY54875.1 glutamine synthetase [Burkholderia gladioli pv. gladioli]KGC11368.1 glutamine synthetase, catalytic domain protein [Burkholderia gladioli]PEH37885.1 glutamine synthetase [Burkholderia gladioli]
MSGPFVERHALWSDAQAAAAERLIARLDQGDFDTVRFSFPDQHGILRGKTLVASEARKALRSGVGFTATMYAKDTSHRSVFSVFSADGGLGLDGLAGTANTLLVGDPTTFRALPWSPRTGWLLCDAYLPDGAPVPFATRAILGRATGELARRGWQLLTGLEVEFHVFRLTDAHMAATDAGQPGSPVEIELLTHGYQYLTELRFDAVDDLMQLLRDTCQRLELPVSSLEIEFGPSQFEFTFAPQTAAVAADSMLLFRNAVKQVCARHGYHATFMCRPRIPNVVSSGWHLHQSLTTLPSSENPHGRNLFIPKETNAALSPLGMHYLGGLLAHARAATPFATPTINGYKRFRANSLAPDRACWAHDNRGAMARVLGGAGDEATRIENRVGEPAANPYLYFASQIVSGLDGIERQTDPGKSADNPYATPADTLPGSLSAALDALERDAMLRETLGAAFVDYFVRIKRAEIARYEDEVSQWEQREYFNLL